MAQVKPLTSIEVIARQIYQIRGESVMLDQDLADLYGVPTGRLNEQVSRNRDRFPKDFMFRLTDEEFADLKSQIAISSWGGRRYAPRAFTQEGVAMLSSVLRSQRAIQVNIAIMRTFVRLRQVFAMNEGLAKKLALPSHQGSTARTYAPASAASLALSAPRRTASTPVSLRGQESLHLQAPTPSRYELGEKEGLAQHDQDIAVLFKHVKALLDPPAPPRKNPIGYGAPEG